MMEELPPEIQRGVRSALGERFRYGLVKVVQVEAKGEKTDNKILALKHCRAFILSSKNPPKLEHEFNYLELELIESNKPKQIKLKLLEKKDAFVVTASSAEDANLIVEFIAESLKRVFPHTPLESFFEVKLEPSERLDSLQTHLDCFSLPDLGPCGGFSQMYQFMCDYHNQPYMDEVAWDIDTIYLSQDSNELCLNDFDHLEAKDLIPILSTVTYNTWFKKLTVKDIRLGVEAAREVTNIIKRSTCLEQLVLNNTGFRSEFARDLALALQENSKSALVFIDLSDNNLDDRGIKLLSPALARMQNGLVELSLANIGITAEGASTLGKALSENNFYPTSLKRLNLSGNLLKDGNIEHLVKFLSQPNNLIYLDLSDCGIALDTIFSALYRGSINLAHINLSRNVYTHKKVKESTVPQAIKQFFATTTKLQSLDISNCRLYPDSIKDILLGIGSNRGLEKVEVDLSSNELRNEGAKVIASCIANVPNITTLNLSNNDFCVDMASLIAWISQNKVLTHLDISENLVNIRQKSLQAVLDAVVDMIQDEASPIRSLSVARNKLKFETIPIINALGSNTTLTSIDISGNQMGDIGARMLAKALQINCKLETVMLDNNAISPKGFQDIADALERNYSLKSIPPPVADLTACMRSGVLTDKAESAFKRIQVLLHRNHSPHKFADAQAFRLQQGFLYTTSHQLVDKLVVQIQDACKELSDCNEDGVQENIGRAGDFIKDADNSKQLLEVLHGESRKSESDDVTAKLKEMATQIHNSVETNLKKTADGMIEGTKDKCPHVMENEELKENVMAVCMDRSTVPDTFVLGLIEQLNAQLSNQMSEANLAMAAHISDTIIDEIIDKLSGCHQTLAKHLSAYRNRSMSLSLEGINGPTTTAQDTVDQGEPSPATRIEAPQYKKKEGQAGSKNELRDRRKSVKLRPKSVMVQAQELVVQQTVQQPSSPQTEVETPKKSAPSASSNLTPAKKKSTDKKPVATNLSLGDFDAVSSSSQRPLRDARVDRPRRVRNVRPTRAVAVPQKDNNHGHADGDVKDVSQGVEGLYKPADQELVARMAPAAKGSNGKADKKSKTTKDVKHKEDKKEKDDKRHKKKEKEAKEPEKKKKGGFLSRFGGGKRKGSTPVVDVKEESPSSSSTRRASEPVAKDKGKVSPKPPPKKLSEVSEESSGPPTPEYRSEDELANDVETKKEPPPKEEPRPVPAARVALKPKIGGAQPISPNVLAEMKTKAADRKSKEILDTPPKPEPAERPKSSTEKPSTPIKPKLAPVDKPDQGPKEEAKETEPEMKETEPEVTPPEPVKEEPTEEVVKPSENGEEAEDVEEVEDTPEPTPSPKETSSDGSSMLPPASPTKVISNGTPPASPKSPTEGNNTEEIPKAEPEAPISPTLHESHDKPQSPLPVKEEEDGKHVDEDVPFPEVSSPKSKLAPAAIVLTPPETLDISPSKRDSGASSPVKPPSPSTHDNPPPSPSMPKSPSSPPPSSSAPIESPPSPTKPLSPKSPVEKKLPSPTKEVNPLFVPKKSNSVQERSTEKRPDGSPKKSASIGARPSSRVGLVDVEEKSTAKESEEKTFEKGTEDEVKTTSVNGEIEEGKTEDKPVKEANGEVVKSTDRPSKAQEEKESDQPDSTLQKRSSISDRAKNFQTPNESKPEPGMSMAEKRKSFERKDVTPPVPRPRPTSTPKPAPRPKPKRPLSSEKIAPGTKSPPGSIKKPPPVAGRKPAVPKP